MKAIKTVSTANDEKALNKVLKGMTANELLNDLILESDIITSLKKEVKKLDKMSALNDDWYYEHQANLTEEKQGIAEYLFDRVETALKISLDKMPEARFIKFIDDLDEQSKERTSKGYKTNSAKVAKKLISIYI